MLTLDVRRVLAEAERDVRGTPLGDAARPPLSRLAVVPARSLPPFQQVAVPFMMPPPQRTTEQVCRIELPFFYRKS